MLRRGGQWGHTDWKTSGYRSEWCVSKVSGEVSKASKVRLGNADTRKGEVTKGRGVLEVRGYSYNSLQSTVLLQFLKRSIRHGVTVGSVWRFFTFEGVSWRSEDRLLGCYAGGKQRKSVHLHFLSKSQLSMSDSVSELHFNFWGGFIFFRLSPNTRRSPGRAVEDQTVLWKRRTLESLVQVASAST